LEKEIAMKHLSGFALFLAVTVFSTVCAPAQDRRVQATVPFNFTVGNQTVPAGTYMVSSSLSAPDLVTISNWSKKAHVMILGLPHQQYKQHTNALVFHRYGGQYFLSDIRTADSSMNIHFPPTKAEKRAQSQREEAGLFSNDPVVIAFN